MPGWSLATFDDRSWRGVYAPDVPAATFVAATRPLRVGTPVRVKAITNAKPSAAAQTVQVFDLGRTLSGWVRFRFRAPRGTRVTFVYGETLAPDGRVTGEGDAQPATDTYVAAGRLQEVFEPRFTLHRFRYVQVAGHPVPMSATALVGLETTDEPPPAAPPPAKRP